jgi:hypothetical protein
MCFAVVDVIRLSIPVSRLAKYDQKRMTLFYFTPVILLQDDPSEKRRKICNVAWVGREYFIIAI